MSQHTTIELEGVTLNIEYDFSTPYDDDEQQRDALQVELITTVSGDDITELMWHLRENIAIAVYEKLDLMQY